MPGAFKPHVIDLAGFSSGRCRHEVADQWREAFSTHGFAFVVGHSVPSGVIEELQKSAREFFAKPLCEKKRYSKPGEAAGFRPCGDESVAKSRDPSVNDAPDLVESFTVRKPIGSTQDYAVVPDDLKHAIVPYAAALTEMLTTLMRITAVSLGLDEDFFADFYSPDPENHLRLASYPISKEHAATGRQLGYGAHTDFTGFTILKQDDLHQRGLEVLVEGDWVSVPPMRDAFLVNSADLIEVWTNGRFKSPVHRVVTCCADEGKSVEPVPRLSLVFFTGPRNSALVEPIGKLLGDGTPYKATLAGDHLKAKLSRIYTDSPPA